MQMPRNANVIGRTVARLRYQRGWSQDELVTQLQLLGNINMTRDILANIETLRSPADSKQIEFFAEVFRVREQDLFPKQRHFVGKDVVMELREYTRRRRVSAPPALT
jgi:transcriptional regulator with XRE-family HTH domain